MNTDTKKLPPVLAWTAMGMRAQGIGAYVELREYVSTMNILEERLQVATSALDTIESLGNSWSEEQTKLARKALLKMGFYTK